MFEPITDLYLTKHLGGQGASDLLVERCKIDAGKYALDAGHDVRANIN